MMLGTPRYMSPEQVAGRPVDQRSDIFSLGTVLYEVLTGTKLFSGADATEIMYNVAQLRPIPPSRINRQVPAMLDLVVAKALEKDAAERYQDAHQFAADLRACLNELGVHRPEPDHTLPPDRTVRMSAGEEDKTARIGADDANAADAGPRGGTRAQIIIVDSNTRLRLSQIFDSTTAMKRLTEPEMKDHARLIKSPKPPSLLTQFWFDPELRLLGFAVLSAAVIGTLLAAL
jgi:serine/threonine protein kinase